MPKLPGLPYVRAGVTEGLSANEAFRQYQDAARQSSAETGENWTASRRTEFLQTYAAIRQARGNIEPALTAPKNVPAGGLSIPERPATVPTGFLNWGVAFTRGVGSMDVEKTFHPFRTNEPLTPAEVEQLISDQINESAVDVHGTFSQHVIVGIVYTGAEKLIRGS